MRYLVLAIVALVAGAVLGSLASNALAKRSAYPKAVMLLLQSNSMALRRASESGRCDADNVAAPLLRLHAVGTEIEAAFLAADTEEPRFRKFSEDFRDVVLQQIEAAPTDCAALTEVRSAIGEACKACHLVYRG